ncbi:hypothetical protein BG61_12035 [Caballeronia glathei]|uniref:Uncharacterized protein n=1 Tax=Caballeronia glathei TaxID=60547 RepID=A0A069PVG8_9BURK|nr:hypothetical protein BG61_12035 [Caballeronia glathei]
MRPGIFSRAACVLALVPRGLFGGAGSVAADENHELQILPVRGLERDLVIDEPPAHRMVERARAAFALADVLRGPEARERVACRQEAVDQRTRRRIVQMADRIGAKLGDEPPRPRLPVDHQLARLGTREHVGEEIAVVRAVQPADEQVGRLRVPAQRVPLAVEHVGGRADQRDGFQQRGGRVERGGIGLGGIALGRELEQIRPLGARKLQRDRDARERIGGSGYRAPLLDPRVPGRTHAAQLRDFLPPQSRRAAPRRGRQADGERRQPFAMRADEVAERAGGRGVESGRAGPGFLGRLRGHEASGRRAVGQVVLIPE